VTDAQLELVPKQPAPLTDRQQRALDAIRRAGHEGLSGWDIGDAIGEHPLYCRANGVRLARALKARGLVRQRKGGLYVAIDPGPPRGMLPDTEAIPF